MAPILFCLRTVSLLCLLRTVVGNPIVEIKKAQRKTAPLGCFTDNDDGQRGLSAATYADDAMTVESCGTFCAAYQLYGVEYGRECYCGNSLRATSSSAANPADCSFPCAGDATEICGAGNRLNIYTNNGYSSPQPASIAGIPYAGCFVDSWNRVLPEQIISTDDMTAAECATNCADYSYFGTEWSRECYCGNTAPTDVAPESDCSFTCTGNDDELCGAGLRLTVYGPISSSATAPLDVSTLKVAPPDPIGVSTFVYQGCYTDSTAARVLTGYSTFDPAMTVEVCAAACASYSWFGVEYGSQCFCGMGLESSSIKSPESDCEMTCGGNAGEICGDANRLNVYNNPTFSAPTAMGQVDGFSYQSCWTDLVDARSLTGATYRSDDMTVESCASFCQGYAYFGVEFSRECYCDNAPRGSSAPEADCSELCMGDNTEWCGGPNRLNLYTTVQQAKTPSSTTSSSTLSTSTSSSTLSTSTSSSTLSTSTSSSTLSTSTSSSTLSTSTSSSILSTLSSTSLTSASSSTFSTSTSSSTLSTSTSSSKLSTSSSTSLTSTSSSTLSTSTSSSKLSTSTSSSTSSTSSSTSSTSSSTPSTSSSTPSTSSSTPSTSSSRSSTSTSTSSSRSSTSTSTSSSTSSSRSSTSSSTSSSRSSTSSSTTPTTSSKTSTSSSRSSTSPSTSSSGSSTSSSTSSSRSSTSSSTTPTTSSKTSTSSSRSTSSSTTSTSSSRSSTSPPITTWVGAK